MVVKEVLFLPLGILFAFASIASVSAAQSKDGKRQIFLAELQSSPCFKMADTAEFRACINALNWTLPPSPVAPVPFVPDSSSAGQGDSNSGSGSSAVADSCGINNQVVWPLSDCVAPKGDWQNGLADITSQGGCNWTAKLKPGWYWSGGTIVIRCEPGYYCQGDYEIKSVNNRWSGFVGRRRECPYGNASAPCAKSVADCNRTISGSDPHQPPCRNQGYYIEDGICKPKIFTFVLNSKVPGISTTMQCSWKDSMGQNGFIEDFPEECALPLMGEEVLSGTEFRYCRWANMERRGSSVQQRVGSIILNAVITTLENGHVFRLCTNCDRRDTGESIDYCDE